MGEDAINAMYSRNLSTEENIKSYSKVKRKKQSQPAGSLVNTNGPVALLGINRDESSMSHRAVNKKVRNTRDVLNVRDYKTADKFEQYLSPSSKPMRVTSATAKRNVSALKIHSTSKMPKIAVTPSMQGMMMPPIQTIQEKYSRHGNISAMTTLSQQNSLSKQRSSSRLSY